MRKVGAMDVFVVTVCVFCILVCIVPFLNVLAMSLSDNAAITSNSVLLWPKGFHLEAFRTVLYDKPTIYSFFFTIALTAVYVVGSMFMTICCAYPLSKRDLIGRKPIFSLILFTMYFSGGLIPTYLLFKEIHLINTIWVLLLPGILSTYNMIILRTFFSNSIPESLIEAAKVEGCGEIGILLRIVLPLSKPVLATLSLFYAVSRWNGFMDALYYVSDAKLYPLQYRLYQIINSNMATDVTFLEQLPNAITNPEAIKCASIIFTITPIIMVYPFLQKYFVKGVMIGSVKG